MLKERLEAAENIVNELHPLERLIDKAIARGGTLTAAMMHARIRGRLTIDQGQRALDHIAVANQLLAQARAHIVAGHQELKATQHDIGIGAYALGDTSITPDPTKPTALASPLDGPLNDAVRVTIA